MMQELLEGVEGPTLDFKREYALPGSGKKLLATDRGELIKDILALANSAARDGALRAYLIVGRSDKKPYEWRPCTGADLQAIQSILKDECEPQPPTVSLHDLTAPDGTPLLALEITAASTAAIHLKNDIKDKHNVTRHRGTVFVRYGEGTAAATPPEIDAINQQIRRRPPLPPTRDEVVTLLAAEIEHVDQHYRLPPGRRLAQVFVPRRLRGRNDAGEPAGVTVEDLVAGRDHALIVGEPGAGKTVALLHAVYARCHALQAAASPGSAPSAWGVAFYLHANELADACSEPNGVAAVVAAIQARHSAGPGLSAWLQDCLACGRAMLAIDGRS